MKGKRIEVHMCGLIQMLLVHLIVSMSGHYPLLSYSCVVSV